MSPLSAYVFSPLTVCIANEENARAFSRIFFHPRVLRQVSNCDPSTTILGFKSSLPVFVSGAALARLGHPLGIHHGTHISCSRSNIRAHRRDKHHPRCRPYWYHPDGLL